MKWAACCRRLTVDTPCEDNGQNLEARNPGTQEVLYRWWGGPDTCVHVGHGAPHMFPHLCDGLMLPNAQDLQAAVRAPVALLSFPIFCSSHWFPDGPGTVLPLGIYLL